jgi:hypothetical protein
MGWNIAGIVGLVLVCGCSFHYGVSGNWWWLIGVFLGSCAIGGVITHLSIRKGA